MKTKFNVGDRVMIGSLKGKVIAWWPERKLFEGEFKLEDTTYCILFDKEGMVAPFRVHLPDTPMVTKL